jgi:hypothetical protein
LYAGGPILGDATLIVDGPGVSVVATSMGSMSFWLDSTRFAGGESVLAESPPVCSNFASYVHSECHSYYPAGIGTLDVEAQRVWVIKFYANMNNCAGSNSSPYAPTWGSTISEAIGLSPGTVQVSQWTGSGEPAGVPANAVSFWDVAGCTNGGGSCAYERNAPNINHVILQQMSGNSNTGYGMYTSGTDYDVYDTWLNSNFQCSYIVNEPC